MKKILIFGMPRTGTTILQKMLAQDCRVLNLIEPFNCPGLDDPVQWAFEVKRGVIKLLAQNLDFVDFNKLIQQVKFDCIVVTQRQNFTDIVVSLYYAQYVANQYHYTETPVAMPFDVPLDYVNDMWVWREWYYQKLSWLQEQSVPYEIFDYDQYCNNGVQLIAGKKIINCKQKNYELNSVSADIDYKIFCTNYQAVSDRILQLLAQNPTIDTKNQGTSAVDQ